MFENSEKEDEKSVFLLQSRKTDLLFPRECGGIFIKSS
jgi:hypothetical protein